MLTTSLLFPGLLPALTTSLLFSGLLPALLFPFVGIMDTKEVCSKYFNYVSMLMLATLLIAESFERCGLHRRLALKILSLLG